MAHSASPSIYLVREFLDGDSEDDDLTPAVLAFSFVKKTSQRQLRHRSAAGN